MFRTGTVASVSKNGTGTIALAGGVISMFYLRNGRLLVASDQGPVFTQCRFDFEPKVGQELACEWTGSSVQRWTLLENYQLVQEEMEELRNAELGRFLMDVFVEDVILPRARGKHPDRRLPIKGRREDLDDFHRKAIAVSNWCMSRGGTNEQRDQLLEEIAVNTFSGKPDGDPWKD